jgi:hypothetical protein
MTTDLTPRITQGLARSFSARRRGHVGPEDSPAAACRGHIREHSPSEVASAPARSAPIKQATLVESGGPLSPDCPRAACADRLVSQHIRDRGGPKSRRLVSRKMSDGQVSVSVTPRGCGEVAERLKAAVCQRCRIFRNGPDITWFTARSSFSGWLALARDRWALDWVWAHGWAHRARRQCVPFEHTSCYAEKP